jgi:AmmeMemoRadiSam system protein A
MKLKGIAFMSHPPVAVPEVGKGQEQSIPQTLIGFRRTAKKIKDWNPEVLIIVSPHGNAFRDAISVIDNGRIAGSLSNFGYNKRFLKSVYTKVNRNLEEIWNENSITNIFLSKSEARAYRLPLELDHGALVPLYFVDEEYDNYDIIHVTPGHLSPIQLYKAGLLMKDVMEDQDKTYAIIASGDLSHALKDSGPYTYHPDGEKFDKLVFDYFKNNKPEQIFGIPNNVRENAKQCGFNSYAFSLGFVDDIQLDITVSSYQGTFGVGYMNGYMDLTGNKTESRLKTIVSLCESKYREVTSKEDTYVKLARKAIEEKVSTNKRLSWQKFKKEIENESIKELEQKQSGAFVTINSNGLLRGCIGTTSSTKSNLAEEIISNAISAATRDPRFSPISKEELKELNVKVDVLGDLEYIESKDMLDVKKYGVVVEKDNKRGLLLPDLEGINTVDEQIHIAKQKANIKQSEKYKLYRFKVIRHE